MVEIAHDLMGMVFGLCLKGWLWWCGSLGRLKSGNISRLLCWSSVVVSWFFSWKSGINAVLNDFWDLILPGDGIERLESGFI
jgi:hypothetical protein